MNWFRDVMLVLVAIGLLVAVLWPSSQQSQSTRSDSSVAGQISTTKTPFKKNITKDKDEIVPVMDVSHRLFPIIEGAQWRYVVTGPKKLLDDNSWILRILDIPGAESPGTIEVGFGKQFFKQQIWLDEGAVQIGELPFSAPLRFLGNKPNKYQGNWLPQLKYVIDDAVWKYSRQRELVYHTRGPKNRIIEEPAIGLQTDRAVVKGKEKVIVPAGVFEAYHISWTSRIEMRTQKKRRKVLQELTVEPFKQESMWFSPGVGMVRRRVTYLGKNKEDIIFDLVSFHRPNMK